VTSEHPLSGEKDTELNERLIGYWRLVGSGEEPHEPEDDEVIPQFVIARTKSSDRQLEMVVLMLDEKGYARVRRVPVLATQLGGHDYVSLLAEDEEKDERGYFLLRYALPEDDLLHVWILNPQMTAAELDLGKIEGRKEEHGSVHLTSDTAALRAWLKERAGEVIEEEKFLVFRRLSKGPGNDYEGGSEGSEAPDEERDPEDDE
jgi:hypothetical protein